MTSSNLILYHWSPKHRRGGILRRGICPGQRSNCKQWKPPYTCWSDSPSYAWGGSAAYNRKVEEWDLWMAWRCDIDGVVERLNPIELGTDMPTEFRVYARVPKRNIWLVGTRTQSMPDRGYRNPRNG